MTSALLVLALAATAKAPATLESLIDGAAQAMTAPGSPFHGQELEPFVTSGGQVRAFAVDAPLGGYPTRYIFLIRPTDGRRGPLSITVTRDPWAEQFSRIPPERAPLVLDEYSCRARYTLGIVNQQASYEDIRAQVVESLEKGGAVSSTTANTRDPCPYIGYVLPGLTRDR